jgi:hypothetical protein
VDPKHFAASDLPLLTSYCVAINQEREANRHLRFNATHVSHWNLPLRSLYELAAPCDPTTSAHLPSPLWGIQLYEIKEALS